MSVTQLDLSIFFFRGTNGISRKNLLSFVILGHFLPREFLLRLEGVLKLGSQITDRQVPDFSTVRILTVFRMFKGTGNDLKFVDRENDIRIVHEESSLSSPRKFHFFVLRQIREFPLGFSPAQNDIIARR